MQRAQDNDIVQLDVGDVFPVSAPIAVAANNLTLRSGDLLQMSAVRRSSVVCGGEGVSPMLAFGASITSFAVWGVDFRGRFNSSALRFNASVAFSSLRIEQSSFVDFEGFYYKVSQSRVFAAVHLDVAPPNGAVVAPANSTEVVVRDVLFANSSVAVSFYNRSSDDEAVRGSMLHLGFAAALAVSPDVRFERVLVRNCTANLLTGPIVVLHNQQLASLLFDHVTIENCTAPVSSGLAIARNATTTQLPLPLTWPQSTIVIRNCVLRSNHVLGAGLAVVAMSLMGFVNVSVVNTTFADNSAFGESHAQALFIQIGVVGRTDAPIDASAVVSVGKSAFVRNGFATTAMMSTSTAGAVALVYGDQCTGVLATVSDSVFTDNVACTDCLNGPFFGGAIHVSSDSYLSTTCNANRIEKLVVDNCVFQRNVAGRGGAIGSRNSCAGVTSNVTIRHSMFHSNLAASALMGDGGAIVSEADETAAHVATEPDTIFIDGCNFFRNKAASSGGAVAVSRGLTIYASTVRLTIVDSEVLDNFALDGEQLSVALVESMRIANTRIIANRPTPNRVAVLNTFANNRTESHIVNSTIRCPRGFEMAIENITNSIDSLDSALLHVAQFVFRCQPCGAGTYNMFGEGAVYALDGRQAPSTFQCHECPVGARHNCSAGAVGTSAGFWSPHIESGNIDTLVHYYVCPPHYCCEQPDGCEKVDTCTNNRTGVLCGECVPGFTHAFAMHGACVESCSSSQVWIANAIVLAACAAFVAYTLLRKSATSDGLIRVIVAFCNVAQVSIANSISLSAAGHAATGASFSGVLRGLFAFVSGLIEPQSDDIVYCPMETMTSFEKLLMPLAVPLVLLCMWAAMSLVMSAFRRLRFGPSPRSRQSRPSDVVALQNDAADDEQDLVQQDAVARRLLDATRQLSSYRVYASLLTIIDFSLFIVVGVSVSLLNTVIVLNLSNAGSVDSDVDDCRLWHAADVRCTSGITAGAAVMLVAILSAPVAFHLWHRFRPESTLGVAIADVFQSAMSPHARLYHFAITARRTEVAFVSAFVVDSDLRILLLRTVMLQAVMLCVYFGSPFASRWVSRAELMALIAVLVVLLVQSSSSATDDAIHRGVHIVQIAVLTLTLLVLVLAVASKPARTVWRWCRARRQPRSPPLLLAVNADAADAASEDNSII